MNQKVAQSCQMEPLVQKPAESADTKLDPILSRIDLIAVLAALLGVCALGMAAAVMAVVQLVKLVSSLWSDSIDRWLIIVLGLTILWIIGRGRKLFAF